VIIIKSAAFGKQLGIDDMSVASYLKYSTSMTIGQFKIVLAATSLSLFLALFVSVTGLYNRHLEQVINKKVAEANTLQAEINKGELSQKLAQNIIQDLANISANKPDIQGLLARYGVTLSKPPAQ
jgi:hypothetical protein